MPATVYTSAVITLNAALYGYAPSNTVFNTEVATAAMGVNAYANGKVSSSMSNADLSALVLGNMGLLPNADLNTALTQVFALNPTARGQVIMNLANLLSGLSADATYGAAANAWNASSAQAYAYSSNVDSAVPTPFVASGTTFVLTAGTAAGADVMRLVGDQDVKIDFTNPANQVTGLDLNGNGTIDANGKENVITGKASGFEIVDAYARNPQDNTDKIHNFLGDITFDGTGFKGDGVATNGNIFLGGLGNDKASGGDGNDFLAGGGIAQGALTRGDDLYGMRNADFFFAEFSFSNSTDGGVTLAIDGGTTADDSSAANVQTAMDSDWLLFEGSDDDEPVHMWLNDDNADINDQRDGEDGLFDNKGRVVSRSGESMTIDDVENVDASGNLYGFLNGMNGATDGVQIGGRGIDSRDGAGVANYGLGSSAQLWISGSDAGNVIVGGYDNDYIEGRDGNDTLLGGNLQQLMETVTGGVTNPNLAGIVNDGLDVLMGGDGNDAFLLELDGGTAAGEDGTDTVFLTNYSIGRPAATEAESLTARLADGIIRLDLGYEDYAGYRGDTLGEFTDHADEANATSTSGWRSTTADQTNYVGTGAATTVTGMESVIATGMGQIDYLAAGTNKPELAFTNQQNFFSTTSDLELRGTDGANTLYASSGEDILEGRQGNDKLSGGSDNDDFVFDLAATDGVDVIHRQADANADNIWDKTYVRDFGLDESSVTGASVLQVSVTKAGGNAPGDELDDVVNFVSEITTGVKINGVFQAITLNTAAIKAATTYQGLTDAINAAIDATSVAAEVQATLQADGFTIFITDSLGRELADTSAEVPGAGVLINQKANTQTANVFQYGEPEVVVSQDRIIYKGYEDRTRNEGVDDDAILGSTISLGSDNYAEDLVISFAADGTRIAEDQAYSLTFADLTTEDWVTITVNGVEYKLQVGKDLDNQIIDGEDRIHNSQADVQLAFLERMEGFINTFMDDDTASGEVSANWDGAATLTLTQAAYNGEETVFMTTPVVTLSNLSGGKAPSVTTVNVSQHEVHLLDFDGRNNALNNDNVLFVGEEFTNRAILETALTAGGALNGSEAMLVDGGVDTLAGIAQNTHTNADLITDFSVHGDDFLLGSAGLDTIKAGTGDDRVVGSMGLDNLDGGKNYYAVKVLGEAEARVVVWNVWEAANPTSAQSLLADPTLAGKTISTISLIGQSESGHGLDSSGEFDDTLLYQQADFNAGTSATPTRFTVTLDNYTVVGGVVHLNNGGAGHVTVDLTGNGATADDTTAAFANFENVRTVSGTGQAVADAGQGNDTLNVAALSTATGGISYDLTDRGTAGEVNYSANAHASTTNPAEGDFESFVMRVDGVENVIAGLGDDLLMIDESEAAKDNSFSADLGDDRIEYQNDFTAAAPFVAEPTVTIWVNTAANTDVVEMTGGRVGATHAMDTLTSVEIITLLGETAQGVREDDVLNVTAMTAGAIVNYNDVAVTNETAGTVPGTVRTLGGVLELTIENLYEVENVLADGDDTVILASASVMSLNAHTDENGTDEENIQIDSFLNFDFVNENDLSDRLSLVELASGEDDVVIGDPTPLPQSLNFGQFRFSMSEVGTDTDNDTIDYSQTVDSIAAVVNFDPEQETQYVMVDGDGAGGFDNIDGEDEDRVDEIVSAENIVAAQGESILDLTGANQNLRISFSNNFDNVADWNGAYSVAGGYGREVHEIKVASATTGTSVVGMNFLDYKFIDTSAAIVTAIPGNATWTSLEGSDWNENVDLSGWEADAVNVLNLRGGHNQVNYEGDSVAITIDIVEYDDANPATTGLVTIDALHTAPGDDHNALTVDADVSATDVITSYSAQNEIHDGSLTIKGARGDLDTIAFAGGLDGKFFILGGVTDATSSITVTIGDGTDANSLELVGFETLQDADTDDTYRMDDLSQIQDDLSFLDNAAADRDTIQVFDDAIDFDGGPIQLDTNAADTISLEVLNDVFGFDFNVLDITNVTDNNLLLVGDDDDQDGDATLNAADTDYVGPGDVDGNGANDVARDLVDDLVVGDLDLIDSALGFANIWLTNASIASAGDEYVLDITGGHLQDDSADLFVTDATGLNFSRVTSAVTVSVVDGAPVGAIIVGGTAGDTITGGNGNDTLEGGGGNDTLDGGIAQEVRQIQISLPMDAGLDSVELDFGGWSVWINEVAGAPVDIDPTGGSANLDITAGSSNDALGALLVTLINAQLADINLSASFTDGVNPVDITGVSYDAPNDILSFTFAAGADVTVGDVAVINGDAQLIMSATATTLTDGGDGGDDTFVFAESAAANGADTIIGFQVGGDTLDFTNLLGDSNSHDIAANATDTMHGDGEVYVFADGADGGGAETITNYTNMTDVAAFLAGTFTDESPADGWITAVINDLLTGTAYVYDVRVDDDADDLLDAGSVVLMGTVNADGALTTGDINN